MEIERKFLLNKLPDNLSDYPYHNIEQAYLCRNPVVRIRRQDDDYILTYKGDGKMIREEYNLPLNKEAYYHLREKIDGNIITKKRYEIPLNDPACLNKPLTIELDIFEGKFEGTVLAEVEFESKEDALAFKPPAWFSEDVTQDSRYHNSTMSK